MYWCVTPTPEEYRLAMIVEKKLRILGALVHGETKSMFRPSETPSQIPSNVDDLLWEINPSSLDEGEIDISGGYDPDKIIRHYIKFYSEAKPQDHDNPPRVYGENMPPSASKPAPSTIESPSAWKPEAPFQEAVQQEMKIGSQFTIGVSMKIDMLNQAKFKGKQAPIISKQAPPQAPPATPPSKYPVPVEIDSNGNVIVKTSTHGNKTTFGFTITKEVTTKGQDVWNLRFSGSIPDEHFGKINSNLKQLGGKYYNKYLIKPKGGYSFWKDPIPNLDKIIEAMTFE